MTVTERLLRFAFAEAETAQRLKRTSLDAGCRGRRKQAVWRAIGVPECQSRRDRPFDYQLALVHRRVMRAAQGDEIRRFVAPTVGARI